MSIRITVIGGGAMGTACAIVLSENPEQQVALWARNTAHAQTLEPIPLHRAFPELSFTRPVFLDHAGDSSNRVFVVEQRGVISVFPNRDDVASATTFLDISDRVNDGPNEAGLLSAAFHPRYADNGLCYIYYNHGNLLSRIAEFRVSADPNRADPSSERVLLDIDR